MTNLENKICPISGNCPKQSKEDLDCSKTRYECCPEYTKQMETREKDSTWIPEPEKLTRLEGNCGRPNREIDY